MKETLHDVGVQASGFQIVTKSIPNVNKAIPATKLVFLEDSVATGGGLLALITIIISEYTPFYQAEGIASIIIEILMFLVVGKVFLDNAAGVLGEVDEEMHAKIAKIVLADPEVKELPEISVLKEGDELHVELKIEVDPKISLAKADDIQDRLEERILTERGVTDVVVEFDENDQFNSWESKEKLERL